MKLISFDIQSNFGFFRKPETNNTLNVSYNIIHKPAILGFLGAIIGLNGYQEKGELPEYYQKLNNIKVGITPLNNDKGNFSKTPIKYSNTVGYANKGTNFLTEELTLVNPQYRIFLLLDEYIDEQKKLLENIHSGQADFIPYFGKNEFTAWWDKNSYKEYQFKEADVPKDKSIKIISLFLKNQVIKENTEKPQMDIFQALGDKESLPFMYFERLPVDFDKMLMQYEQQEMVYTTYLIKNAYNIPNLYLLINEDKYVQLL